MKYIGAFKRCDGEREEKFISLFERMIWANVSRRLGPVGYISIETKVEDGGLGWHEFSLKFPESKKDTVDKVLGYLQDYDFYEINYEQTA
ncbi:hypothetical protein GF374_00865 [Candidatus Woesearchaeota archaeon]|nr:hypothetical protein [Candidatus Woesearchaeota archaeon]